MKKATSDTILAFLETHLSEKRLKHVLGVRDTVIEIAQCHGIPVKKAEYAALIHDAAKWMKVADQLAACKKYKIRLTKNDRLQPSALHAYVAAEMAMRVWGMDTDVAQAIRAHTTGWKPMSALDMALYCADFSEPSREYPEADIVHAAALNDLHAATVMTMTFRLHNLLDRGALIHPRTVEARNALLPKGASNDE